MRRCHYSGREPVPVQTEVKQAMPGKLKVGVLVSGGGTNLQAIMDHAADGRLDAEVAVVISNVETAYALERARQAGVNAVFLDHRAYPDRAAFDRVVVEKLREHEIGLVALAGYMRIFTDVFTDAFAGRIMNIHPSLIPAFCGKGMHGLHVHQAVLDYGAKVTGCTVHFVTREVDAGPIILQRAAPVLDDDTAEILSERVLEQEHEAYSDAIQLFAEARLRIEGRRVRVLPPREPH